MGRRVRGTESGGGQTSARLCAPEITVLWHQKIFRMSSSFFQEPLRSSSPRSFMPKDLRGRGSEAGAWGCPAALCPQPRGLEGADQANVQSRGA